MRNGATLVVAAVALAVTGCSRRALTPYDFGFVTTNTTFLELTHKVGSPHRVYVVVTNKTAVACFEWDLRSVDPGSRYAMLLTSQGPPSEGSLLKFSNRVQTVELVRRPTFIDFSTNRGNH
jgi:hypothetical protein